MTDVYKRALLSLLSALTDEEAELGKRTQAVTKSIRDARSVLGMIPLSEEDILSHMLVTTAEVLGEHCTINDQEGFTLDLVDKHEESAGPFIAVTTNRDVAEAISILMEEASEDDDDSDYDDTDEDEPVTVNVKLPESNWEN